MATDSPSPTLREVSDALNSAKRLVQELQALLGRLVEETLEDIESRVDYLTQRRMFDDITTPEVQSVTCANCGNAQAQGIVRNAEFAVIVCNDCSYVEQR